MTLTSAKLPERKPSSCDLINEDESCCLDGFTADAYFFLAHVILWGISSLTRTLRKCSLNAIAIPRGICVRYPREENLDASREIIIIHGLAVLQLPI
jgi:hypothetical protein